MATIHAIKQLEERNVASEIVRMVWSDRMDLVALANVKGEVTLYRLTWTKAWTLCPPKVFDCVNVKSIVWRPDGKIIAIAYNSGQILLVEVENKNLVFTIETKSDISCLGWIQDKRYVKEKNASNEDSAQNQFMKCIDKSSNFLPESIPQQFETSDEGENEKRNLLQEQSDLNLLLIGTQDGFIHIQVFGCFPCATLNINSYLNTSCTIENIHLSEGLNQTFITVRDSQNKIKLVSFNSDIFSTHTNELYAMALKHIKLTSLLNVITSTITTITESWESILLEMDNKLSNYASKVPEGGVTADFLELLMFGICSDEMKAFLIHDLTKKGLEKFGQTIEMSYSNIQNLVLKYVMKFGQNVTYHLAEMRGMARLEHRYKILGLQEDAITAAILSNGAFMIKAAEMQQVINHSITNYKAFFRWLYTAIGHVLEEQVPNEVEKMTQQDLAYITEFLQNFDHIGQNSQIGFRMERLGQYLNDSDLTMKSDMSGNEWSMFLAQNQCVQKHQSILTHFPEMSLIQQFKHLKKTVDDIYVNPKESISGRINLQQTFDCFQYGGDILKATQINLHKDSLVFAFLDPPETVLLMHMFLINDSCFVKCANMYFEDSDANYHVLDVKLYSPTLLSVLLQDRVTKATILSQIPLNHTLEKFSELQDSNRRVFGSGDVIGINGWNLVPRVCKSMEGMVGAEFAVSGSRKVGIVLAENRRKVRLYEMEGEEEEDEDADMTNSTYREVDMSVQELGTPIS